MILTVIKGLTRLEGLCEMTLVHTAFLLFRGFCTERARLSTFRGLGTERARLGTFRGFGTERARLGTFRGFLIFQVKLQVLPWFE